MRTLFSSLVATSLLIHAAIGCCWHHTHVEICCDDSQLEQPVDADGHHHGEQGDHSHGPCKDHCHGTCHYLPVQKAQVDPLIPHTPLDFAAVVPATCDVHVVALLHADRTYESAAAPPVRLHLFQQLLLI